MSNNNNNAANDISHARSGQRIDGESQRPSTGAKPAASRGNVASNLESILRTLKEAGEMVPSLPYIKGITGIMLEILKVKDEVVMFKGKWQEVMTDIDQIRSIVEHFGPSFDADNGHQRDNALFIAMHKTLRSFEIVLKDVTENLIRCCATRDSNNPVTNMLQRHELCATVETCGQVVKQARSLFDMKLSLISTEINFANNYILQKLDSKNTEKEREVATSSQTANTSEQSLLITSVPTTSAFKVRHPDPFDGSKAKTDAFMTACKICFAADPFFIDNDKGKVLFVLSYMTKEDASIWAHIYIITTDLDGPLSWSEFQTQFDATFGDSFKKGRACGAIINGKCQQENRSISQYNLHFNILKCQSEYTDESLLCFYYQKGLNSKYLKGLQLKFWNKAYSTEIDTLEKWQKQALIYEKEFEAKSIREEQRDIKSYKQGSQKGR